MKTLRELQAEFRQKNDELQGLLGKEALSAEESVRLEALVGECEQLQADIKTAQEAEQRAAAVRSRAQSLGAWAGQSAGNPAPGTATATNPGSAPGSTGEAKRFAIPAAVAYSQPKHFKARGEHSAAERAYGFGRWILAAMGDRESQQWCLQNGVLLASVDKSDNVRTFSHVENVNTAGGVLVPPEFESDIIDLREKYGIVRRLFRNRTMKSDTKNIPRRTGGVTAYFATDLVAATESQKSWDNVQLIAKKLIALVKYSSELGEDAIIDVADDLMNEIAYAFAVKEDQCGLNGDGTSTYGGITGLAPKLLGLSATRANIAGAYVGTGNLWSELILADFNYLKAKLPAYAAEDPTCCWLVSQAFWSAVMERLALAAGGITDASIVAGVQKRFLGFPVEISQAMPLGEANDQVCALLGVFNKAADFGDRRMTTLMMSEHSSFSTDGIDIRGTERFDVNCHDIGNADATAANRVPGPVVGLLTAAS